MRFIADLIIALWKIVVTAADAIAGLFLLAVTALRALLGGTGELGARLAAAFTTPAALRWVFSVLRFLLPNLVLKRKFVQSYDNSGSAIVTRFVDVREVLRRDEDFHVVYEPRMRRITDGGNFFLGMQNSPEYVRDVSNMRIVVRRSDIPDIVAPLAEHAANELAGAAGRRVDVPQDIGLRVPARLVGGYFGTPGPSEEKLIEWATIMFWYLFNDLSGDKAVGSRALEAARECRDYLDETIRKRKAREEDRDDVLGRCLELQDSGAPGMTDTDIRNNLVGLIIGAIPTISTTAVQALDQLLDRPSILDAARRAVLANDDDLLRRHVLEALRFNLLNPVIYRRAVRDTVIARGTLRARSIPKDTMVFASNLSAMFDPWQMSAPRRFRVDRPWDHYQLWGDGLHRCFGDHINQAVIPAVLKPLLSHPDLRRAEGGSGLIDRAGTPFPVHFFVEHGPK